MAYQDSFARGERQMFQGNWNCSKCGTAITELPFEPDPSRVSQLLCRDCHRENRPPRPRGAGSFERRMYEGDWTCSQCGGKITELPFQPSPERTGSLLCRNCHREKQSSFR